MSKNLTPRAQRVSINREFASLDEFIKDYASNISRSGVFIRTKENVPVGTLINLSFTVIAEDIEIVKGVGEVVRVQSNPPGIGVEFRSLNEKTAEFLDSFLAGKPEPPK